MSLMEYASNGTVMIDYETRDGEIARRNILFGYWAGRRIGLSGSALENYALSVHFADRHAPGHDDLIAKVAADLAVSDSPMNERQLRYRLREMAMRAHLDLSHNYNAMKARLGTRAKHSSRNLLRKSLRKSKRFDQ